MVKEQIDSQIGIIYYTNKQFEKAAPYLENAFSKKLDGYGNVCRSDI